SMSDPGFLDQSLSRRKLVAAGVTGAAGYAGLRTGRAFGAVPKAVRRQPAGPVTLGSLQSDAVPEKATAVQMGKVTQLTRFTDKDGWPAMGTFDIINMRLNGYAFHIRLMAGKESWNTPQVKNVFKTWSELLPYYSQGALGLTWQEGTTQLENKQAGMYLLGS